MNITYTDRNTGKTITETPPAEGLIKFLYHNPFGEMAILPIAKRKFISDWYGRKKDKPSSVKDIPSFVEQLNIDMSESQKKVSEFTSFNDFFYRKLKPEARPIGEHFVSPGDGKLLAFESISDVSNFFVKGRKFTLQEFLDDKALADKYASSSLLILRLAPNDYHRYHFPFDGTPTAMTKIKGSYMSVSPYALVSHFTKVFCENKREFCELKTKSKGDIILAPVGATMVGGIVETYQAKSPIDKGDEMGYFKFGGSTVVILCDRNQFKIDADLLENTKNNIETAVKMGETIAR